MVDFMRISTKKERVIHVTLSFFMKKSLVKQTKEGYHNTRRGGKWLRVVEKVVHMVEKWKTVTIEKWP